MASAGWTVQKFNESVQKGRVYPLYYLYGDETFLIDEALSSLERLALGDGLRDFNLNTFYGADAEGSQLRNAIETLPMLATTRVVVLKEAQELKDRDWELLMPLLDSPIEMATFICTATKIDKRKKFVKRFMENGVMVEFKRPFENQIPEWVHYIARKHSLEVDRDAASLVHQFVGSNLTDINSEIAKLRQYLGSRKEVHVDDVLAVTSRVRIDSVFDLTDAIGSNDRARALFCLANLLDHGQSEVGVLALITRHVRILKLVADGQKEGLTGPKLSSRAGVSPYFLRQYMEQSRQWSAEKIEQTYKALLDTDRALKSSPVGAHIWLENFIVQTCNA